MSDDEEPEIEWWVPWRRARATTDCPPSGGPIDPEEVVWSRFERVRRFRDGWLASCPAAGHGKGQGDRHPSLSISIGREGQLLLWCHAGCPLEEICGAVGLRVRDLFVGPRHGTSPGSSTAPSYPVARDASDPSKGTKLALDLLQRTRPIQPGGLIDRYLHKRVPQIPRDQPRPGDLRESTGLRHPNGSHHPAMVAVVRDVTGKAVACHRTYVADVGGWVLKVDDEKVPETTREDEAKFLLGPVKGAAIRVGPDAEAIVIGEGIESTLAASAATGRTGWAAISVSGIRALALPSTIRDVLIAYDRDPAFAGQRAALVLLRRLRSDGVRVELLHPPQGCSDFADLHIEGPR